MYYYILLQHIQASDTAGKEWVIHSTSMAKSELVDLMADELRLGTSANDIRITRMPLDDQGIMNYVNSIGA